MNDPRIDQLYLPIRSAATELLDEAAKIGAFMFSGYRSLPDQKETYAQGRTVPGPIVTDARPGFSYHNYGLALDLVFEHVAGDPSWSYSHDWNTLGAIGKSLGFEWGGDWPDPYIHDYPHFQMTFDISVQRLYIVYARTWKLTDVWSWLDIKRGVVA